MVGALGKALAREGHEVVLVTPLYAGVRDSFPAIRPLERNLDLPLGARQVQGRIGVLEVSPGLKVYFVDQPEFFGRAALYQEHGADYADNAERFIFLSKATVHLARHLDGPPDVAPGRTRRGPASPSIISLTRASFPATSIR